MFHKLNNRINKIHKRALKLVYKDNKLSFNDLLELDNSVTIHQRNLQILATEIFKVKNSLAPEIMTEVFEIKEPYYNCRSEASHFKRENVKSTHYGIQSVRHLGLKIWNIVPQNIIESNSLNEFKSLIKFWKPDTCPCILVHFAKTTFLKWVLFDLIYVETICLPFSNHFFFN